MTKLRKKLDHVHGPSSYRDQGTRGPQAPAAPVSNLQGAHHTYIVGGVSVSSRNPIRFDTAENIVQAAGHALALGYPLEYHLTVKWPDNSGSLANHYELLRKIGEWQEYNIGKRVFIWSREAKGGPHSHILLHIPRDRIKKFRKLVRIWLKQILGLPGLPAGTMRMTVHRKIGASFDHIRNRVRYILKGADAETRLFLGCTKSETTYIQGKRAGASQALNRKARRQAGGVLPSGARHPTREMLEAARERDRLKDEARAAGSFTSPYSSTVTPAA